MPAEFYHLSPVILTDDLFFTYRPDCMVTGTAELRQAAYLTAEQQMVQAIGTPLVPTTVTGTYLATGNPLILDFDRVQSIDSVVILTDDGACNCDLTREDGCAQVRGGYGYIDVKRTSDIARSKCGCGANASYKWEIAFTAGLPTGTSSQDSNLHIALAMAAELDLKEMIDPGALEGGPGDPGLTSFGTQGYSESRVKPRSTPFGQSAMANHIFNRIKHLRKKRALRF